MRRVLVATSMVVALAAAGIVGRAWFGAKNDFRGRREPVVRPAATAELAGLEDVSYPAAGNVIRGWYVPARNGAAVALVHGTEADRSSLLDEARLLARHGFGVLLIDLPGCGESTGRFLWGRTEIPAVIAAFDWLSRRPDVKGGRLGLLGFSAGAYFSAIVAGVDPRPRAVVLEGIVIHPEEQTRYEWGKYGLLSQLPALWSRRASGYHREDPSPEGLLPQIAPRPVLFISGAEDKVVLPSVSAAAFALARDPKQIWIAPGARHGDYARAQPAEYERRLAGFFEQGLLQP